MKFDVLTLFPEMFEIMKQSIFGKAMEKGIITLQTVNIRDFSKDKHKKVDDTPYGGGAGMVMMPDVVYDAYQSVASKDAKVIYMSPQGKPLNQKKVEELAKQKHLIILCGHYEGIDQRVLDKIVDEEISIGDYILTGGELPAMVLIDAVARFLPEVLGNAMSADDESIYSGLLECDQYTKPRSYQNMEVPEVLTGGNHKMIHLWQFENALNLTRERRPDLWEAYLDSEKNLTKDEKKILEKVVSKPL